MFEIMGVISMTEMDGPEKGGGSLIKYIHEDVKGL